MRSGCPGKEPPRRHPALVITPPRPVRPPRADMHTPGRLPPRVLAALGRIVGLRTQPMAGVSSRTRSRASSLDQLPPSPPLAAEQRVIYEAPPQWADAWRQHQAQRQQEQQLQHAQERRQQQE